MKRNLMLLGAAIAMMAPVAGADEKPRYANPVLRGDYPDPSVIRVGELYYATATSSEWAPHFPLLVSRDLVNWEVAGSVFEETPEWASGSFWAPEICEWKGKYYLYYTARKKGGPLAVAVATAPNPMGPWTDHGPLVAQEAGSIDGAVMDMGHGQRWLVWKEDGNSRQLPTVLWAQRLDDTGTKLTGEPKEIMRNDAKWEGAVVEGPHVMRVGEWFYLFYAGNSCCGGRAEYAEGVARSKELGGPWEKCPANPVIGANEWFRAPGHGSVVDDPSGRHWLVYHSYVQPTMVFTGREMMLDEVTFGADGWPVVNGGKGPSRDAPGPLGVAGERKESRYSDQFMGLAPGWQWPMRGKPDFQPASAHGKAKLRSRGEAPAILGRSVTSGDVVATLVVGAPAVGSMAGLSACGDPDNMVTLECGEGKARVVRTERGKREVLSEKLLPAGETLRLRMGIAGGRRLDFAVSADGKTWTEAGSGDGGFLPPWDRSIRTAVVVRGEVSLVRFDTEPVKP
jgi:beta-xylosidase